MSSETEFKGRQSRPTKSEPDVLPDRLVEELFERSRRPAISLKEKSHSLETGYQQLKLERTKTLLLASRVEDVLREHASSSDEELRQTFDALIKKLMQAEEAIHSAHLEHASKLRAAKSSLRKEYSQHLEVLRQTFETELATRTQEFEQRLTAEFKAKLARAREVWKAETELQLTQSTLAAQHAMSRAHSKWKIRTRVTIRRMARVWRARERKRLAKAQQEWRHQQRDAIKSFNWHWKEGIIRLRGKLQNFTSALLARERIKFPVPLWISKLTQIARLQIRILSTRK